MSVWPFLVLQIAIFIGLVMILRRILGRNLTDATAHLQSLNAEYSRRQEELKQRLSEAEQQYKEQTTKAKIEAEHVITQARQEAESSRSRLLTEARAESERIVQQGMESRDALRREIEETLEARAIEWACELIQSALPGPLRQFIQSYWLDELLGNGLAGLNQLNREELVHEVHVVSAFPLNTSQRQMLDRRLNEKLGQDIALTEATNERLVAGLIITIGSLVLDGSLASKVRQAARRAQHNP